MQKLEPRHGLQVTKRNYAVEAKQGNKQIYEQKGSEFISNVYDFGKKIFTFLKASLKIKEGKFTISQMPK